MISETAFPELDSTKPERVTGVLLKFVFVGHIRTADPVTRAMALALARLVDGVCLDYTSAREAYFRLYNDDNLGVSVPISFPLLSMAHHIENCLSNLERTREMADAIRVRKPEAGVGQLIDKADWRVAETHERAVAGLRNAIQHQHNELTRGDHHQSAIDYRLPGELVLGSQVLALADLAKSVEAYRTIALKVAIAVGGQPPNTTSLPRAERP